MAARRQRRRKQNDQPYQKSDKAAAKNDRDVIDQQQNRIVTSADINSRYHGNSIPGYNDPESEAPIGTVWHVTVTGFEFQILKFQAGEVIATATHTGKCAEKHNGFHTHYLWTSAIY